MIRPQRPFSCAAAACAMQETKRSFSFFTNPNNKEIQELQKKVEKAAEKAEIHNKQFNDLQRKFEVQQKQLDKLNKKHLDQLLCALSVPNSLLRGVLHESIVKRLITEGERSEELIQFMFSPNYLVVDVGLTRKFIAEQLVKQESSIQQIIEMASTLFQALDDMLDWDEKYLKDAPSLIREDRRYKNLQKRCDLLIVLYELEQGYRSINPNKNVDIMQKVLQSASFGASVKLPDLLPLIDQMKEKRWNAGFLDENEKQEIALFFERLIDRLRQLA